MNKHVKIIRFISVIVTLSITCIMLLGIYELVRSKKSDQKYAEFHDQTLDYDVLFCGSSHMMNGVYPLELYKGYGISSYNIANSAEAMGTTYWVLKTALDECMPDVVVLEVFFLSGTDVTENQESLLHTWFDGVALSPNKVDAIKSLLPNQLEEYLFNFSLYHGRWSGLEKSDFEKNVPSRGAVMLNGRYLPENNVSTSSESSPPPLATLNALKKIKQLCDDKGITLVLAIHPYGVLDDALRSKYNYYSNLADEWGIDFLDLTLNGTINYGTDLAERAHLNPSGARKVTEFYGKYLTRSFDMELFKNQEIWESDYEEYLVYKDSLLKNETDFEKYMVLLHDSDYKCTITINEENNVYVNDLDKKMLIDNITNREIVYKQISNDVQIDVFRTDTKELVDSKEFGF